MPVIAARTGVATFLRAKQVLKIINTHGSQVVDTWAFINPSSRPHSQDKSGYPVEFMSMSNSRQSLGMLRPCIGSTMVSNRRLPVLTFKNDTSPGIHDTLISPCSIYRYHQIGRNEEYHDNCSDNLHLALEGLLPQITNDIDGLNLSKLLAGLKGFTPDPLNLFMNVAWQDGIAGNIQISAPKSSPGDYVELEAERDMIVAMSACPNDKTLTNGGTTVDAHYEILD